MYASVSDLFTVFLGGDTARNTVKENSSPALCQVWFCIRAATFLLLVKEEGKESEAALTAGSPLPRLMFAWEQGESLTAPDKFYCLKVTA